MIAECQRASTIAHFNAYLQLVITSYMNKNAQPARLIFVNPVVTVCGTQQYLRRCIYPSIQVYTIFQKYIRSKCDQNVLKTKEEMQHYAILLQWHLQIVVGTSQSTIHHHKGLDHEQKSMKCKRFFRALCQSNECVAAFFTHPCA